MPNSLKCGERGRGGEQPSLYRGPSLLENPPDCYDFKTPLISTLFIKSRTFLIHFLVPQQISCTFGLPFHLLHNAFIIKKLCDQCKNRRSIPCFVCTQKTGRENTMYAVFFFKHTQNGTVFMHSLAVGGGERGRGRGEGGNHPPLHGCSHFKSLACCFTVCFYSILVLHPPLFACSALLAGDISCFQRKQHSFCS